MNLRIKIRTCGGFANEMRMNNLCVFDGANNATNSRITCESSPVCCEYNADPLLLTPPLMTYDSFAVVATSGEGYKFERATHGEWHACMHVCTCSTSAAANATTGSD